MSGKTLFQDNGEVIFFFCSLVWNCDHRDNCLQIAVMPLLYNVQMSQQREDLSAKHHGLL